MALRIGAAVLAVAFFLVVLAAVARVSWLEGQEVMVVERGTLAELARRSPAGDRGARLVRARLSAEQEARFELCADDPMRPERWAGAMAVVIRRPREVMTEIELDAASLASVRRDERQGCLLLTGTVGDDDVYAVVARWDERPAAIADVPLTITIQARRPLSDPDLFLVLLAWVVSVGLVVSLAVRKPAIAAAQVAPSADDEEVAAFRGGSRLARAPAEARVVLALVLVVAAFYASGFLPGGAAISLAVGVALALLEVGLALGLAPGASLRARAALLSLERPGRAAIWFPVAALSGIALWYVALEATSLVPSSARSAIQTFVSWPSGLLSFAALAVLAPLAEEVFFRGLVYGLLEKRSRILAFTGAWLLFVLAHGLQTWGQWGALLAIAITGLGLTALRRASGSALVPAVAHLVYNGLLAVGAIIA